LGGKIETLHGEAKAYLDSLRAVSLGQERISATFCTLLDDPSLPSSTARQARMYKDIMELLAAHGRHEIDDSFRAAVLEPITRFAIAFPECEELARKRAARLLDYDAIRSKVRKATDKPSSNSEKLPRVKLGFSP
jgi:amphiphysin